MAQASRECSFPESRPFVTELLFMYMISFVPDGCVADAAADDAKEFLCACGRRLLGALNSMPKRLISRLLTQTFRKDRGTARKASYFSVRRGGTSFSSIHVVLKINQSFYH